MFEPKLLTIVNGFNNYNKHKINSEITNWNSFFNQINVDKGVK